MKNYGEEEEPRISGRRDFNLTPTEHTNYSLSHKHTGIQGDGQRIAAASLSTVVAIPTGAEFIYIPVNAPTSGRTWRIQIEEVTDPDTNQIQGRLVVTRVT